MGSAWAGIGLSTSLIRVCADLAAVDAQPSDARVSRWEHRIRPWTEMAKMFRSEGFYERFPAKGQVERVARIQKELARVARIEAVSRAERKKKP